VACFVKQLLLEASSSPSSPPSSPPSSSQLKKAQLGSMNVVVCSFAPSLAEKQILGNQTRSWGAVFFSFLFFFFSFHVK
jgi:hypothetical protein